MITKNLALAVSLALLGACTLGPNYTRPDLGLNSTYRGKTDPAQARALEDIAWSNLFRDAELTGVLKLAIERNIDLQIALNRIEAARAQTVTARSQLYPNLSGGLGTSPNASGTSDNAFSFGVILNWELDFFGKLRHANRATRADMLASEDGARAVMSTLVATTANTWLSLRELDQELLITQANVKSQEQSLALVRALLRGGVASGAEEQQAIYQLATTRAQLPRIEQAILSTENALSLLLGGQPGPIARHPVDQTLQTEFVPKAGLPSQLLERRPDVRAAEHILEAATERVGVAIASRFPVPSIGLGGFLGFIGIDLGDTLSNSGSTQSVTSWGPNVSMPLVDWGRGAANVSGARANAEIAALNYRGTVLNAMREVSNALSATQTLIAEIEQWQIGTKAAEHNLRLQQMRYKAGVSSYFEVLDAQRQVYSAQISLARNKRDHLQAYVELYRALGGGWSDAVLSNPAKVAD